MKRKHQPSANLSDELFEKVSNELKLGYLNLADEFFVQAQMNFMLALEYDPNCADAFWGLMLVKLEVSNEDDLLGKPVQFKIALQMDECKKALELADKATKKQYESLLDRIIKINEGDNY